MLAMTTPALAADLLGSAPTFAYPASQAATAVEVGTNWYVRGDLGAAFDAAPSITLPALSAAPWTPGAAGGSSSGSAVAGFAGDLGFGYRVNNYVRFDATWTYWAGVDRTRSFAAGCPFAAQSVYLWSGAPGAYARDASQNCTDSVSLNQHNNAFLANAYGDLGTYGSFTPYIGGGIGANMHTIAGSGTFLGTSAATGDLMQYWTRTINSTNWSFAWSLTAGFSFQLTPSIALDASYRYLNGGQSTLPVDSMTGLSVRQTNATQLVLVGFRLVPQ